MPSRRFAPKRRHGCANCKQRRIRCGEEQPTCQNCGRLGGTCSFLESDALEFLPGSTNRHGTSAGQEHPAIPSETTPFDPFQYDNELIHQYTTATYFTITDDETLFSTWQVTVPTIAQSFPFLRHGMLALSAMHLRLSAPADQKPLYTEIAHFHQGEALRFYIPHLQVIGEQSCPALFAFSTILPALSYAFLSSVESDLHGEDYITRFLDIWKFVLGACAVATESRQWIRQSIVSPLVKLRCLENVLASLASDPKEAIKELLEYATRVQHSSPSENQNQYRTLQAHEHPPQPEKVRLYEKSIVLLSNAFATNDGKPPQLGRVIGWLVFVDEDFVQMLREKDHTALIILAYYGAALHCFNGFWWLENLGARLVHAVSQTLPPNPHFGQLLAWPLQHVIARL